MATRRSAWAIWLQRDGHSPVRAAVFVSQSLLNFA